MTKRFVAIVLVVWMSLVAPVAVLASEAPHVVAGGLYGPGADVRAGPLNPANAAHFVFYSTTQPAHAFLTGATNFTYADGTTPALWARNVDSWTWLAGDAVVAVAEARRNVNGWNGRNHTTSIDGILQTGVSVQDLGNGTLEPIPTVTPVWGPDYVRLSWASLTDPNGNVVSYEVLHGTSAAVPPANPVARIPHGGAASTNQSGLTPGPHCFAIAVNYRRDTGTGVYTTVGLSEPPICATVIDVPPEITLTTPDDGDTGVALNAPVIVEFSEPMDTATVVPTSNPPLTWGVAWSNGNRTLTLSHTANFAGCANYAVTIAGSDRTGNALVSGPVPNPFDFWALCPSPFISLTNPASGAVQVRTDASIVIRFSEPMVRTTVQWTIAPTRTTSAVWNSTNDTVTISLINPTPAFDAHTPYTVNVVAGQDVDGNNLVSGAIPNPWSFTTNTKPTVDIDPALNGICVPGGSTRAITWTMGDYTGETLPSALFVTISATGATSQQILPRTPGPWSILSTPWSVPGSVNGIVTLLIEVEDGAGETGQSTSGPVEIDSILPDVSSFTPADQLTGVSTSVVLRIRFTEAMDTTATQGAVAISGGTVPVPAPTFDWPTADGDTVLDVTTTYQAATTYTVTVGPGARDSCGNLLGTAETSQFTTAPPTKVPSAPTGLTASAAVNAITLTWTPPTTYTDGSPLPAGEIQLYIVLRATSSDVNTATQVGTPTGATYTDSTVQGGVRYYYWVRVRITQNRESAVSEPVDVEAQRSPEGAFPWLLLLIPLIVILLVVGIWLMRGRKPETAAPPPPQAPPRGPSGAAAQTEPLEAPPPEAAPEELASESTGDFIACPNCGTMVKPTDAECFVCGAKL